MSKDLQVTADLVIDFSLGIHIVDHAGYANRRISILIREEDAVFTEEFVSSFLLSSPLRKLYKNESRRS